MSAGIDPDQVDDVFDAVPVTDEELQAEEGDQEDMQEQIQRRFLFWQATPAWLVSTLVHALILLVLGLISIANPIDIINVLTASANSDDGPEIEELTMDEIDPGEIEETEEVTEPVEITEPVEMVEPTAVEVPVMDMAAVPIEMSDFASEMAPTSSALQTLSTMSMKPMGSRSADMKKKLLREYGGTESSEAAVTEALKWFSRHQIKAGAFQGAWTFAHSEVCRNACGNQCDEKRAKQVNAATALALLPFMGAGQTHLKGEYKQVVWQGLKFLIQNGKPGKQNGLPVIDYRGGGNMYDHGLAAITLCEAYAMTGDPDIAGPAQAAINFIVAAQGNDGGWRYGVRDNQGDTSVVGWQVMALKSGYMGHLAVPPATIKGSMLFLDRVGSDGGSIYGYTKKETKVRPATTAVGLLCRMYSGWDKTHPGIVKGVQHLSKTGVSKKDLYYDYYAAQVLRHAGGPEWDKFNAELRDYLVETQAQEPGAKGSWYFDGSPHMSDAGRLCITSFATMILEVYYRHMPLYAEAAAEEEFPL
ncbi:prenyltransferase/squalene oxidase repeat-containing protein [Stieleria varia]|uniref:Squalene cyclase C-terminal domain-containing protein n=1 Tax=Stieleria varia TaxID=2528005 RepID=A0A5C5ZV93_9BACT|nr:hypothetical protein [Stieleria varia]TWT91160.1 hypothetical protein Pla52n_67020 [Stieleria varia]